MAESRITSKYQVTIPKKIRKMYGIEEGDEIVFLPFGEKILIERKKVVELARELPLEIKVPKAADVHKWREIAKKVAMARSG
ncbi:MAG: AbrB/MazE/SpoVT family DNA-binding domain-containing protein [Candidatus Hydrothermarchaeota archaeon]|nr:AbrB/MazE/SpoVT family DNA-binding domain-containing protein [Candidatus Hydrothermarchaeota archaeon]